MVCSTKDLRVRTRIMFFASIISLIFLSWFFRQYLTTRGNTAFIYQFSHFVPNMNYLLKYIMFFHASVPVLHTYLLAYNIHLTTDKLILYLQNLAQMLSKGILLWSSYNTQEFISLSLCKISIPFIHLDDCLHLTLQFYLQVCIPSRLQVS